MPQRWPWLPSVRTAGALPSPAQGSSTVKLEAGYMRWWRMRRASASGRGKYAIRSRELGGAMLEPPVQFLWWWRWIEGLRWPLSRYHSDASTTTPLLGPLVDGQSVKGACPQNVTATKHGSCPASAKFDRRRLRATLCLMQAAPTPQTASIEAIHRGRIVGVRQKEGAAECMLSQGAPVLVPAFLAAYLGPGD